MPILTHIAGSPGNLSTLAEQLEGAFATACDDLESALVGLKRDTEDNWEGDVGDAAAADIGSMREGAASMQTASSGIGAAIETFSSSLRTAQNAMQDARDVASEGGLTLTEQTIEGPPEAADPAWLIPGPVMLLPAEEPGFEAWSAKQEAYVSAERTANDAIEAFGEACQQLVDDLGGKTSALSEMGEALRDLVPGGVGLPGERVLPGVENRMRQAATRAGFFASISPEQSRLLYQNLFLQMDQLGDADSIHRLANLSKYGGKGVDAFFIGLKIIEREELGQSTNQILLAEGGGWAAGVVATAATWGVGGALVGGVATPVGSVILGGVSLIAGVGAGILTSNQIDDWYEDREFEEMIRNAQEKDMRSR